MNRARKDIQRTRVLLVDDHPLVREGLMEIINRSHDLVCCGEADSTAGAISAVAATNPDVVLLDLRMQRGDGLELIKTLKAQSPSLKILVLSQLDENVYAERVLRAGARGYIMKDNSSQEILSAIRTVFGGGIHVSENIRNMAVNLMAGTAPSRKDNAASYLGYLTDRELQILRFIGDGFSIAKIAAALGVSKKTVQTHRDNIKHKLGLADGAAVLHFATILGAQGSSHKFTWSPNGGDRVTLSIQP